MEARDFTASTPLCDALSAAVQDEDGAALDGVTGVVPANPRDRLATLLTIYDLHLAPVGALGSAVRHQHHPAVAQVKERCEREWLAELDAAAAQRADGLAPDLFEAMRALAARDRLPAVYRWVARRAEWPDLVRFLALEGGPDAGFDDLVAICQVGLRGAAKLELAVNFWDEMGDGDPAAVHTALHDRMVAAIDMPRIPLEQQPTSALARAALGGLLATNRWLQPEMLGALGLTELQAGPRCRVVERALRRCGAPRDALVFYTVHADVDPRHGKDWLEKGLGPLVRECPSWTERIVRGAAWRSAVNDAFFRDVYELLSSAPAGREAAA
jgi:hypothetical protein